ncbi:MAG: hypothetical protein LAT81_10745 [Oceanicaulis sp.]|nr:hypothetical protein [Oceanicaulis sp.]
MLQGLKNWLASLDKRERAGVLVLGGFVGAVLIFALGTQAGSIIYQVLN